MFGPEALAASLVVSEPPTNERTMTNDTTLLAIAAKITSSDALTFSTTAWTANARTPQPVTVVARQGTKYLVTYMIKDGGKRARLMPRKRIEFTVHDLIQAGLLTQVKTPTCKGQTFVVPIKRDKHTFVLLCQVCGEHHKTISTGVYVEGQESYYPDHYLITGVMSLSLPTRIV
ncbi:MAG: hypothetical protein ACI88C_000009 [Acidimicrobiales bacterium]|jgi:hypothetical protein